MRGTVWVEKETSQPRTVGGDGICGETAIVQKTMLNCNILLPIGCKLWIDLAYTKFYCSGGCSLFFSHISNVSISLLAVLQYVDPIHRAGRIAQSRMWLQALLWPKPCRIGSFRSFEATMCCSSGIQRIWDESDAKLMQVERKEWRDRFNKRCFSATNRCIAD